MRTIPVDQVLRQRHLKSALDHIFHTIAYTEALAGRDNGDLDQLCAERRDLKHVALIIDSIIGSAW